MQDIEFAINKPITPDQFISVLRASTLAERRPVHDLACVAGMLEHADLTITAWHKTRLIAIARSVTDFHYCCYVSDLAVDITYQKRGIGKRLLRLTQEQIRPGGMIILLSAPAAVDYYTHIGMQHHPQAFILPPGSTIS